MTCSSLQCSSRSMRPWREVRKVLWIALAGVERAGNLGAACRAMANFGFTKLLLIEPKCSPKDADAQMMAKHARPVLNRCRLASWKELRSFDLVVGTTAKLGSDYNLPRSPLLPEGLAARLSETDLKKSDVAILFGPEGTGLSNEQLIACDIVVTIPSSKKYPTLNLSHAVAVLCYELSRTRRSKAISRRFPLAPRRQTEVALGLVDGILPHLGLSRGYKEETQRRLWRRLLGKAMPTGREMAAL